MFAYPLFSEKIKKYITFTQDSKYLLKENGVVSEDQYDLNKLFGFTSGLFGKISNQLSDTPKQDLPFYYRAAHWNSARFVWYYDPKTDNIQVTWYVYDKGVRMYDTNDIVNLKLNKEYELSIIKNENSYKFTISEICYNYVFKDPIIIWSKNLKVSKTEKVGWSLPLYFGGNKTAPSKILISIKNK
jgi:hypothetical protein